MHRVNKPKIVVQKDSRLKNKLSYLITLIFIVTAFSGCSNTSSSENDNKIHVMATSFPQYDWVRQIIGKDNENVEVSLLVDSGIDLHSFQPSVEDIAHISNCDMFIYTGGISDVWVEDALKASSKEDRIEINLLSVLGNEVKDEEHVEGMQHEEEHEDHDDGHIHEDESEIDEHIWLSLKNAKKFTTLIALELSELDSENASKYKENSEKYIEALDVLDSKYEKTVNDAKTKTLLFGDRFPFRYLIDDYDIDYYAAFAGCSAETEASFETIIFLANKMDELELKYVMTLESSDQSIAKTIIDNTKKKDQDILVLDSIQSVGADNISLGISYLAIMENNFEVIKKALG